MNGNKNHSLVSGYFWIASPLHPPNPEPYTVIQRGMKNSQKSNIPKSESNLTFDHAIVYCRSGEEDFEFRLTTILVAAVVVDVPALYIGKVQAGIFCTVLFEKD